jgi:hypothetical protein
LPILGAPAPAGPGAPAPSAGRLGSSPNLTCASALLPGRLSGIIREILGRGSGATVGQWANN